MTVESDSGTQGGDSVLTSLLGRKDLHLSLLCGTGEISSPLYMGTSQAPTCDPSEALRPLP